MTVANPRRDCSLRRFTSFAILLASLIFLSACASLVKYKDNSIPQRLTPVVEASFDDLLSQLKAFINLQSMRATRVSMKVTDAGTSERYRGAADATIVVKRPDSLRLIIQVPVAKTKLAEMVSEANKFKVAIYYNKYRRFLIGTNDADYSGWRNKLESNKEVQQSGFINARPFHFTDALMVRPLQLGDARFTYSLQEELLDEADERPNAKKGARVLRSYYVISEIEITDKARSLGLLKRRFWFDRTDQLHLARQQVFDSKGKLLTDIRYAKYMKLNADSPVLRPSVVEVRRPYDAYSAELNFLADSIEFNVDDLPATAFVLENTEKLPETDLDKSGNK